MKVTIMLADFAQVVGGKLYIMGGGWSITGPNPTPSALAIKIEVPWTEANRKHNLKIELVDADHQPVIVPTQVGNLPVVINGDFEVGRPPGLIQGTPIDMPMAFNIGPLPLTLGSRYVWRVYINDVNQPDWQVAFSTRPASLTPIQG